MTFIELFITDVVSGIPYGAVIIKKEAGINAVSTFDEDGIAPWTGRFFCCNDIVISPCFSSFGYKCVDNIKGSIMIPDGRSPQPEGCFTVFIIKLIWPVDSMSNLFPVS